MSVAEQPELDDAPTPDTQLLDALGRPYFLWDVEMTLEQFVEGLRSPDLEVRAYLIGKLMRQARPADVPRFVALDEARALWPMLQRYLGQTRERWRVRLGIEEGNLADDGR